MSVGLVKPKMSPPGTSGVPFGGSTFVQRSATLAGLAGALRGTSAAMAGVVKHAINRAEKNALVAMVIVSLGVLSGPLQAAGCLPARAVATQIADKSQDGALISRGCSEFGTIRQDTRCGLVAFSGSVW